MAAVGYAKVISGVGRDFCVLVVVPGLVSGCSTGECNRVVIAARLEGFSSSSDDDATSFRLRNSGAFSRKAWHVFCDDKNTQLSSVNRIARKQQQFGITSPPGRDRRQYRPIELGQYDQCRIVARSVHPFLESSPQ